MPHNLSVQYLLHTQCGVALPGCDWLDPLALPGYDWLDPLALPGCDWLDPHT